MRRRALLSGNGLQAPSRFLINTDKGDGLPEIFFGLSLTGSGEGYEIDWGDGITTVNELFHEYDIGGTYIVSIRVRRGYHVTPHFNNDPARGCEKIIGVIDCTNMRIIPQSFYGCINLEFFDKINKPYLTGTISYAFSGCAKLNGLYITQWDFTTVYTLQHFLIGCLSLNDIGGDTITFGVRVYLQNAFSNTRIKNLILITPNSTNYTYGGFGPNPDLESIIVTDCSADTSLAFGLSSNTNCTLVEAWGLRTTIRLDYSGINQESDFLHTINTLADLTGSSAGTIRVKSNNAGWTGACDSAAAAKNWTVLKI